MMISLKKYDCDSDDEDDLDCIGEVCIQINRLKTELRTYIGQDYIEINGYCISRKEAEKALEKIEKKK